MKNLPLLSFDKAGIYCEKGDFYIDPWRKVNRALITHAHSDHARIGNKFYLAHKDTIPVLKQRLGPVVTEPTEYGKRLTINGVKVSFHPAGHIIGSSQIRIEYKGEVWVVSGDYKLENDNVSAPFESVKCDFFVSETTFGLPIYKWKPQKKVFEEINSWWKKNAAEKKATVLYGYSLGKAQRIIQNIDFEIGPVYTHGAVENVNQTFRENGISIHPTQPLVSVALWKDDELVTFTKAYSGLTNKEIVEVDKFIRQNTTERFGPVRSVKPILVFELGFEGINRSSRHKSGIAVRFPRILRWRRDKAVK